MKVIITFTFCCDNLWKSKSMALEKPGKIWEFFLLLCGHPVTALIHDVLLQNVFVILFPCRLQKLTVTVDFGEFC